MRGSVDTNLQYRLHRNLSKFLGGLWREMTCSEIKIKQIVGGLSNLLYLCSLPENKEPENGEPASVLVRIFGDFLNNEAVVRDCVVFAILAEKGLGPHLYGVFPGGRIEEFIPSVTFTIDDFPRPEMIALITQNLARFHSLKMPVSKDPNGLFTMAERYEHELEKAVGHKDLSQSVISRIGSFLRDNNINEELEWLKKTLEKVNSPVVFCHNDLQAGNILKSQSSDGSLHLKMIDYEFSGYGYRGFDLANHFCEWTFDNFHPEPPYYRYIPENAPSRQQLSLFFREYRSADPTCGKLSDECLLQEVEYFTLLSHLVWSLWSAGQYLISSIQFDYMSYAELRMDLYKKLRDDLSSRDFVEFENA